MRSIITAVVLPLFSLSDKPPRRTLSLVPPEHRVPDCDNPHVFTLSAAQHSPAHSHGHTLGAGWITLNLQPLHGSFDLKCVGTTSHTRGAGVEGTSIRLRMFRFPVDGNLWVAYLLHLSNTTQISNSSDPSPQDMCTVKCIGFSSVACGAA